MMSPAALFFLLRCYALTNSPYHLLHLRPMKAYFAPDFAVAHALCVKRKDVVAQLRFVNK